MFAVAFLRSKVTFEKLNGLGPEILALSVLKFLRIIDHVFPTGASPPNFPPARAVGFVTSI